MYGPTMQYNSKTYYHMFQLSYVLCPQPKSSLINHLINDRWTAGCLTNSHSAVASAHQHLAQNFNRPAPIALTRYCNLCLLKYRMSGSHRLVAITEVWRIVTKQHDGCLCTVHWTAVLLKPKLAPRL